MPSLKFKRERKHYLNPFAKLILHITVAAGFILSLGLALVAFSWLPIIVFFIFTALLETFYWYDVFYGWPVKRGRDGVH
jgi:hypothetical protein